MKKEARLDNSAQHRAANERRGHAGSTAVRAQRQRLAATRRGTRRVESEGPAAHAALQRIALGALAALLACSEGRGGPQAPRAATALVDLADLSGKDYRRVYGSVGSGVLGVPVAGGFDVDGDSLTDYALASFLASPGGKANAGSVFLVFGDGLISGSIDTATAQPSVLRVDGAAAYEHAGSEVWMDDVTGDGIGDLLVARQDFAHGGERVGAGALTIVVGGAALRERARALSPLDLASPEAEPPRLTIVGSHAGDRLGIWVRTGDVTGDGVADILVGADQHDAAAEQAGAAYLIAGGTPLSRGGIVDLASNELGPAQGRVLQLLPPAEPDPRGYHFGATCQIGDLDGNGRGELLLSAALNRSGASLDPFGGLTGESRGGAARGELFILFDDAIPDPPWAPGARVLLGDDPAALTRLRGQRGHETFGEELVAGADWDADGRADLFVGDLVADFRGRPDSGISHVVYEAERLRGLNLQIDELAELDPPIRVSSVLGASAGDLAGDTAGYGDVNGDGIDDLITCSPHASPGGRHHAGAIFVLLGNEQRLPGVLDLATLEGLPEGIELVQVHGATGTDFDRRDEGDTLCYSAAVGDADGDGRTDLIVNEMVGNGLLPAARDVGNLVVLSVGQLLGAASTSAP